MNKRVALLSVLLVAGCGYEAPREGAGILEPVASFEDPGNDAGGILDAGSPTSHGVCGVDAGEYVCADGGCYMNDEIGCVDL